MTIGGLVCAVSKKLSAITASSWLDGFAFGMTVLMIIIISGENSDTHKRGKMASTEALAVSTGIFIFCMFITIFDETNSSTSFTVVQTQGVLSIIFGLAACGLSFFYIETPVYHLMKGDQNEAINALSALHNETAPSPATYRAYEEFKEYVHYDESKSIQQHVLDGLLPLAKVTVVRVFMMLTMVIPIPSTYSFASFFGYKITYGIIFFGLTRWIGTFVGQLVLIDKVGRKKSLAISSLIIGILYIVIGALFNKGLSSMSAVATLLLVTNFFCGMSQNVSSVYLSEAFSASVKSGMIFAAILIENLVVIIVFAAMRNATSPSANFFVIGTFQILIAVMAVTILPETKNLCLQKALEFFQGMLNIGF